MSLVRLLVATVTAVFTCLSLTIAGPVFECEHKDVYSRCPGTIITIIKITTSSLYL
ncbi:hypothetical protein DPMN_007897 [Dreissena polymorpha]|uniref:Uncharacterized protein n=1 Tax=Dreissena polymorpha TaxID=45954 RepID=A0A9D4MX19_DREPO|nr:hypothetical protein DPMN_007897 [Dreissena polymorpha]